MKAKKVYEFINPKTDEYDLEDTIELGPTVLLKEKIWNWYKEQGTQDKIKEINIEDGKLILKLNTEVWNFSYNDNPYFDNIIFIDDDNVKYWYFKGKCHREDGPAIEWPSGTKKWYQYDLLHREDGPAIENIKGLNQWWFKGNKYSKEQYFMIKKDDES